MKCDHADTMPRLRGDILFFDMDETIVKNLPEAPGQYEVRPYADAIRAIRELRRRGYRIYPATTNAGQVCRIKLGAAGLAEAGRCDYFDDLFGGDEVCPGGKTGPQFFTALLERIGAAPDQVVMVGDHPRMDLAHARAAGIHQVVLPRRDQEHDVMIEADGGIYVRSLVSLLEMLPLHPTANN